MANNPGGVNSFNHWAPEPAYGQVSQADRLKKAYPVPGVPDAGKQAQRRAVKGGRGTQTQVAAPTIPAPQGQVPPEQFSAMAWQEIAASSGASPLVKEIAARANS